MSMFVVALSFMTISSNWHNIKEDKGGDKRFLGILPVGTP